MAAGSRTQVRFVNADVVREMVNDATSETLTAPDWAQNTRICDLFSTNSAASVKMALKYLRPRLKSKVPEVQLLTLELIDCLMKNCLLVRSVFAEKEWQHRFARIATKSKSSEVKARMLGMIQEWSDELGAKKDLKNFRAAFQSLVKQGVMFPPKEVSPPVVSPPSSKDKVKKSGSSKEEFMQQMDMVRDNVSLLTDILNSLDATEDDEQSETIKSIHRTIADAKPNITAAVDKVKDESALENLLNLNDSVVKVLELYETVFIQGMRPAVQKSQPRTVDLIDLGDSDSEPEEVLERGGGQGSLFTMRLPGASAVAQPTATIPIFGGVPAPAAAVLQPTVLQPTPAPIPAMAVQAAATASVPSYPQYQTVFAAYPLYPVPAAAVPFYPMAAVAPAPRAPTAGTGTPAALTDQFAMLALRSGGQPSPQPQPAMPMVPTVPGVVVKLSGLPDSPFADFAVSRAQQQPPTQNTSAIYPLL
eukprot:TRINITY_DN7530_c0_g1_i1.p1 TRINITY_DN7530_c0_g1~~TRINITY_DN7530_c0_g1_i1.p1  ORF type:complete len:491 (-),score=109.22 TRINITY_DN7530_c0_g1_i1:845-2272(-)